MNNQYFNTKNRKQMNGPSAAVIKYDKDQGQVPTVVAQGTGYVAQKIIETAKENGVILQEDSTLLGNLLQIDLGESVPPQLYGVIAEILVLLEKIDEVY
jgi:flagellar biosynthesis protein